MPELSRFLGMIVAMYYKDHAPPHFHVKYNESRAAISIETLEVLEGELPKRVLGLLLEWAAEHRQELLKNWDKAMKGEVLQKIEPLV